MVKQVTISPSFQKKMSKLDQLYGEKIGEKLSSLGKYAVQISPVDTGAFVGSWSIRPIGSSSGRSRTSEGKPGGQDAQAEKANAMGQIEEDVQRFSKDIAEKGGAVLTNRAPHAEEVDLRYATVARVIDRFR